MRDAYWLENLTESIRDTGMGKSKVGLKLGLCSIKRSLVWRKAPRIVTLVLMTSFQISELTLRSTPSIFKASLTTSPLTSHTPLGPKAVYLSVE
jgi:hypothetical protein